MEATTRAKRLARSAKAPVAQQALQPAAGLLRSLTMPLASTRTRCRVDLVKAMDSTPTMSKDSSKILQKEPRQSLRSNALVPIALRRPRRTTRVSACSKAPRNNPAVHLLLPLVDLRLARQRRPMVQSAPEWLPSAPVLLKAKRPIPPSISDRQLLFLRLLAMALHRTRMRIRTRH